MKNIIHDTPNWVFEAAACITQSYEDKELEKKEDENRFGMSKEKRAKYFSKYNEYKEAVLSEIMPIYNKYPHLEKYFKLSNIDNLVTSIAGFIVFFIDDVEHLSRDQEYIDKLINKSFSSILDDHLSTQDDSDVHIENLASLLSYLEEVDFDDKTKLLLINLYNNRYDLLEEMAELLNQCVPICKKHYHFIRDDFEKAVDLVYKKDDLDFFINDTLKVNLEIPSNSVFYFSIFYFNSMILMESHDDIIISYLGIYLADLVKLKDKVKFNDTQLLADLKAISDPTRLKIIDLVSKDKMYLQEIAEALDLAPSTISHHIQILLNVTLLSITVDAVSSRKVYYETNKEKVESIGDSIKGLVSNKMF